jgi:predicted ester cyclase
MRFETAKTIARGDSVVTCWCMTGTPKAQFRGPGALDIPPANKQFRVRGCTVSEFKNGRVVRTIDYSDRFTVLRQLGVLPIGKTAAAAG